MTDIEAVFEDLEADISLEEFREAVAAKVDQMGGLADEETAAMLVAHELGESGVQTVGDIEPGMDEVSFVAKVTGIGELRTFERDDGPDGRVINVDMADETGQVRVAFWDEHAIGAEDELEQGDVLRIRGRPKEGMGGVEVSASGVEPDEETDIDVAIDGTPTIEQLTLGQSNVTIVGQVLGTEPMRTFERDDDTEGRVANLTIGDPTGRIRVTCWDDRAEEVASVKGGETVEIVDGYVRDREGQLELHVGDRGAIQESEESVDYEPQGASIDSVELEETVDLTGVIRSADPVRTFDRDDGSEGKVRNIRLQDDTGEIRVALWGEKADLDVGPGDRVAVTDVEIQDGWQDDLEASAGWQSTVIVLEDGATPSEPIETEETDTSLSAFEDEEQAESPESDEPPDPEDGESLEFTGVVVQAGDPVVLDNGETTMSVETSADVGLGEEVTARGVVRDGRLDAEDVL